MPTQEQTLMRGQEGLVRAYDGKKVTAKQQAAFVDLAGPKEPDNKVAIGLAGQILTRKVRVNAINRLTGDAGTEPGAGQYESWKFSAIACLLRDYPHHEGILTYTHGMLSAHYLCLAYGIKEVASMRVIGGQRDVVTRKRDENNRLSLWRGPLSAMPALRNWHKLRDGEDPYREIQLLAPYAVMAAGGRVNMPDDRVHKNLRWAWRIGKNNIPRISTDFPDLIVAANALPLRSGRAIHVIRTTSHLVTLMESCPQRTRGPTPVVRARIGGPVLEAYTTSEPISGGNGQWASVKTELRDGLKAWDSDSEDRHLSGSIPGKVLEHIVWDTKGCRLIGDEVKPPKPPATRDEQIIKLSQSIVEDCAQVEGTPGTERRALNRAIRDAKRIERLARR